MARSEMKRTIDKADNLVREVLKLLDSCCCTCGHHEAYGLEAGHWISRAFYGSRWLLQNVHRQCRDCNQTHEFHTESFDSFMHSRYDIELICRESREYTPKERVKDYIGSLKAIKKALESGDIGSRLEAEEMQCLLLKIG